VQEGGGCGRDPADDDDSGAAGMGIAAPPYQQTITTYVSQPTKSSAAISASARAATATSMSHSQGFHHQASSGVYGYSSDGFDRPDSSHHQQDHHQQQHEHVAQQSRRDKLRVQAGFDPAAAAGHGLLPIDGGDDHGGPGSIYEQAAAAAGASNMLSEMFNFPAPPSGPSATELLASQMSANYRFGLRQQQQAGPGGVAGLSGGDGGWFGTGAAGRAGLVLGGASMGSLGETSSPKQQQAGSMAGLATDPAAAMQLFLMNPQQQQQQSRSSPTSPPPSDVQHHEAFQAFGAAAGAAFGGAGTGVVEGQGLSLSLSPSLQQLEMAKQAEELRVRDGVLYFNRQQQQQGPTSVQQQQLPMALHGQVGALGQQLHVGYGPAGVAGVLRNSKYTRAAQELLEEFCSVGRGQIKGGARGGRGASASNPNASNKQGGASSSGAAQSPSSASKEPPQLSPADRFEHQRKKAKLISMLDEARPLSQPSFHTRINSIPSPFLCFLSSVHAWVRAWVC